MLTFFDSFMSDPATFVFSMIFGLFILLVVGTLIFGFVAIRWSDQ